MHIKEYLDIMIKRVFGFCLVFILSSCLISKQDRRINKDFNFFQKGIDSIKTVAYKDLIIQNYDLLSIQVISNSLNQDQVSIFSSLNNGGINGTGTFVAQTLANTVGYMVDQDGFIVLPIIGKTKAAGFTRAKLAEIIKDSIEHTQLIKNPNVLVRFIQLRVSVLGEVKAPGIKVFSTDKITILDAIAASNDLTDRGRRDNIIIIREEGGETKTILIDLRNTNFIQKEGYQLKQNDIVYVNANDIKLKEVNTNPNLIRDIQIGLFATSVLSLILSGINVFKK